MMCPNRVGVQHFLDIRAVCGLPKIWRPPFKFPGVTDCCFSNTGGSVGGWVGGWVCVGGGAGWVCGWVGGSVGEWKFLQQLTTNH